MWITYLVSSFKFALFQLKMKNHYEVHVIFQDIEHQVQENILHHFLHNTFYEIIIKLRSMFDPLQVIYWNVLQHYPSI